MLYEVITLSLPKTVKFVHFAADRGEHIVRGKRAARFPCERGRLRAIAPVEPHLVHIQTYPDDDPGFLSDASRLDEDTAQFPIPDQDVIRPFEIRFNRGHAAHGTAHRQSGQQRKSSPS